MTHVLRLEHPVRFAIIIYVVPPTESDKQASRNVLYSPEIGGKEKHNEYKAGDEGVAEPAAEYVEDNRCSAEKQVEKGDIRMPGNDNRIEREMVSQVIETQTQFLLTCISLPDYWDHAFHPPRRKVSYHRRVAAPREQQIIIYLSTALESIGEDAIFYRRFLRCCCFQYSMEIEPQRICLSVWHTYISYRCRCHLYIVV